MAVAGSNSAADPTKWDLMTLDTAGVLRTVEGRAVLQRKEELGYGSFGSVSSFLHQGTKLQVAVKMVPQGRGNMDSLTAEFDIGRALRHPNICSLHAAFRTDSHYLFVMELVSGGDLYDWLAASGVVIPPLTMRGYLLQLLDAVEYMHSRGIVHCDLKIENVVLAAGNKYCKIIDFGMSGRLVDERFKRSPVQYNDSLAPEQSLATILSRAVDVWGLGVILYKSMTGTIPFPTTPENEDRAVIMFKQGPASGTRAFKAIPQHAQDLILAIMQYRPRDRPSLQDIRQSAFVKAFDEHADASGSQVSSAAIAYQSSTALEEDVMLEVAEHVAQPKAVLTKDCSAPQANNEASMLYNMIVNRNAKTLHGAP